VLLAEAGISIVPQCAYQNDHLLLHVADTTRGVAILESLIASCRLPVEDIAGTTASPAHQPHSTETISIRPARLEDATTLSELAARTFSETFGPHTPSADIAAYLTATYSPELQAAEIANSARTVLVVETRPIHGDPALVGYAYLFRSSTPAVVTGPVPLQLERFYLDSQYHGQGVAQRLMTEVLRMATVQGARTLWLGVWEHNARALAFYRKYGFQRVGEHLFPVGSDPQIDWLLVRPLNTLADTL
jgi:ribosomal protein S18 acetylase RimI-like enzyme